MKPKITTQEPIGELNGFQLVLPTSGGKAGKGKAKTISLQVRKDGVIVKAFRFVVDDLNSRSRAVAKAKKFMQCGEDHAVNEGSC